MQPQSENFKWQLIARSLSGEASLEEMLLLESYLKEDDGLNQQYNALKHFWNSSIITEPLTEKKDKQLAGIFDKARKASAPDTILYFKKRRLKRMRVFAVSFGGLVIIIAVMFLFNSKKLNKTDLEFQTVNNAHKLIAQKGNRSRTVLSDGSVVWLNAASILTYDNFSNKNRQVYLKGEAFFDVVKDPAHPFIVHANSVDIKVLGTAFNIKSYTEDNKVEATLIRGIIQVTRQDETGHQPVFLHPNEKLVIDLKKSKSDYKLKTEHESLAPVYTLYHLDSAVKTENLVETSWIYNKLEFRGDDFEDLAKKLERWYNIKIFFEDEDVKKLSFNGSFENETMQQAFAALKAAVLFDYAIKDNEVFISSPQKLLP